MTMEIDPLEVIINMSLAYSPLATVVNNQIAGKHQYGQDTGDWPQDSQGLTYALVGGVPDWDAPETAVTVQVRCYGDTKASAFAVVTKLVDMCYREERQSVSVTGGTALLYHLLPINDPVEFQDENIRPAESSQGPMPGYLLTLRAAMSEVLL